MSERPPGDSGETPAPRPIDLRLALGLTLLAWLCSFMVLATLLGWASFPVALAVGSAVGYGGIGTLAARQVPPPAELRLGLCRMPPRFVWTLALLAPAVVLASELDNWTALLLPRPELPEGETAPGEPGNLLLLEAVIASVLLRPVVEEFFFRGVIQQGLVTQLGALRGIATTAALFAVTQASIALPVGATYTLSLAAQGIFQGSLLGLVRVASGSLLAPILLHAGMNALGALALAYADAWPIPGFNAPGATTPATVLLPCLTAVALGTHLSVRAARDDAAVMPP